MGTLKRASDEELAAMLAGREGASVHHGGKDHSRRSATPGAAGLQRIATLRHGPTAAQVITWRTAEAWTLALE